VVLGRSHTPFEEPIGPLEEGMGRSSQYPDSAQTVRRLRTARERRRNNQLTAPGVRKMNAIVLSNDYGSDAVDDVLPKTP
jgi:hypothetical protein